MSNDQQLDPNSAEGQQLIGAMAAQVAGVLQAFAPNIPAAEVQRIAMTVVQEQPQLGQVVNDAINPATHEHYPGWGVKLHNVGAVVPEEWGEIIVPKVPAQCKSISEFMQFSTLLGLLTAPAARGILLLHGFRCEFVQVPKGRMPNRIVKAN